MAEQIDQVAALQAEAEEWVAVPSEVDSRTPRPLLVIEHELGLRTRDDAELWNVATLKFVPTACFCARPRQHIFCGDCQDRPALAQHEVCLVTCPTSDGVIKVCVVYRLGCRR